MDRNKVTARQFTPDQWMEILPIAHEYGMKSIEAKGVAELFFEPESNFDPVELLLLAKAIGSYDLYTRALQLTAKGQLLSYQAARMIGFEAFYKVTKEREKIAQKTGRRRRAGCY
ncbi:hypothetical protein FRC18_009886 [Serendipita sp. 400]|nr:hypothetical protein FRC18_009886 [Serendipita sp. 400]